MDRRTLLAAAGLAAAAPTPLIAQAARTPRAPAERLAIWPGPPPGGEGLSVTDQFVLRNPNGGSPDDIAWTHLAVPYLKVTRAARPNGAAVLMLPGGGYARIAVGRAPSDLALMFAARGVTAFELLYRLPHDKWAAGPDAPLQDAQRAMRVIRSRAADFRLDPARLLALGFSAGGHLVGRLGEAHDQPLYAPIDAADRLPAKPVAVGMFFPVVSMGPDGHAQSRRELLGENPPASQIDTYSLERHVPASMPPTFVCCNADDATVKYTNSIMMFSALQGARIPSELMVDEKGGHGVRLIAPDGTPHIWLQRVQAFAARHGWMPEAVPA